MLENVRTPGVENLVERLESALEAPTDHARAYAVKDVLSGMIGAGEVRLPASFVAPLPDRYARRLLHRDLDRGFTVVVMTWGPGQGTPLHDHAGIWCVEGTAMGEMEVVQFEKVSEAPDGSCRFEERGRARALAGSAGALIPPFEYHILRNGLPDGVSATIHVYGGEMDHCHLFEPQVGGGYRRVRRELSYHDA